MKTDKHFFIIYRSFFLLIISVSENVVKIIKTLMSYVQ
jgi:hypothetical protein